MARSTTPPELVMVAANMAKSSEDVARKMYLCPCEDSDFKVGYIHHPAKYIGCYVSGGVQYVGEVAACVRLRKGAPSEVLWKFVEEADDTLVNEAVAGQQGTASGNRAPCLVFLIRNLSRTDFKYDYVGGLQSSRIYFDVSALEPSDCKDLAVKLRDVPWSTLARWKDA